MTDMLMTLRTSAHDLRDIADGTVHAIITSPPYYGLRSYAGDQDVEWPTVTYRLNEWCEPVTVQGCEAGCVHEWVDTLRPAQSGGTASAKVQIKGQDNFQIVPETKQAYCLHCGGWRGPLGLEPSPVAYIGHLILCLREWRRVLREDGVCWVNLGDSYAAPNGRSAGNSYENGHGPNSQLSHMGKAQDVGMKRGFGGLKPKDLLGIPWMFAFAARADGWNLRSDIIWSKPNPMPESVTDRPTKSHEYIFQLSKCWWVGPEPRQFSPSDARWLALLIETEGNIAIRTSTHNRKQVQHSVQVAVANSDMSILEEAQRLVGCGAILRRDGKNRDVYYLQWQSKEAARILYEVYPYLFGKRKQAACALYLESRRDNKNKGKRDDIYRQEGRHFFLRNEELALRDRLWRTAKSLNQHEEVDSSWVPDPDEAMGKWVPQRYYWDAEAVREDGKEWTGQAGTFNRTNGKATTLDIPGQDHASHRDGRDDRVAAGRNIRSVWNIATAPYPGAHYAVFPPKLVEPMIRAATSERGCCPNCGAPWRRVVEKERVPTRPGNGRVHVDASRKDGGIPLRPELTITTLGWQPACACDAGDPIPCTVLDPFAGSGTTGRVAASLGRAAILCDVSGEYLENHVPERTTVQIGLPQL